MQRRKVFEFWYKESSCSQLNIAMFKKKIWKKRRDTDKSYFVMILNYT